MASTNSRCSSSVQLSLVFVIVYSFRAFTSTRGASPFLCSSSSSFIFNTSSFFCASSTQFSPVSVEYLEICFGAGSFKDVILALFSTPPSASAKKSTPKREILRPPPASKRTTRRLVERCFYLGEDDDDALCRARSVLLLLFCCYFGSDASAIEI